jgi:hypothetical protein
MFYIPSGWMVGAEWIGYTLAMPFAPAGMYFKHIQGNVNTIMLRLCECERVDCMCKVDC